MLDLLVVIWLMLHWLKILVAALKSWYRQPRRYVHKSGSAVQRTKTAKLYAVGLQKSKYVPVYKTILTSAASSDDENDKKDNGKHGKDTGTDNNVGDDLKSLLERPDLVKRKGSRLSKSDHETDAVKEHVCDQATRSRLSNIKRKTVERSDEFKELVEGPTRIDGKDQQLGPANNSLENIYKVQSDFQELLNADVKASDESYMFETAEGPTIKHLNDDRDDELSCQLGKHERKRENNHKSEFDDEIAGSLKRDLDDIDGSLLLTPKSCEQMVDKRETKDPVSQEIEMPNASYLYKNELFVETIDTRKEYVADKEATVDFDSVSTETFDQIKPVSGFITLKHVVNDDKTEISAKPEAIAQRHSNELVVDNAASNDANCETEQRSKLLDLEDAKLEISTNDMYSETVELTTLSPKLRKSDVPSVTELLFDVTPSVTNSSVVPSESNHSCTSKNEEVGDLHFKTVSTEMKTTEVDNKVIYEDERETVTFKEDIDASFQYMRGTATHSEYRLYQRNDSFSASVNYVKSNFNTELDELFATHHHNTNYSDKVDIDKPFSQTLSFDSVAPDLEAVTGTMKEQLAATSVLSGIPYSSSFGLITSSPTRYSRKCDFSQPSLSKEIELLSRTSSLAMQYDEYTNHTSYLDLDIADSKLFSKKRDTTENISVDFEDSIDGALEQDLHKTDHLVDEQSTKSETADNSQGMSNFEQPMALPNKKYLTCPGVNEDKKAKHTQEDLIRILPGNEHNDANNIMKLEVTTQ